MRNIRNNKGFTLIELMIVVVIIGILAAIAIPKFSNVGDQAKQKEADGVLKQVVVLQEAFQVKFGKYAEGVAETAAIGDDLTEVGYAEPALKHYAAPVISAVSPDGFTATMASVEVGSTLECRKVVVNNLAAAAEKVVIGTC